MAQKLKNLSITRVALVAAGSNPHADIVLLKKKPDSPHSKEPVFMKKNIDKSKLSTEEQTALDALLAKSATDIADPPPPEPEAVPEDIKKNLPPEVQTYLKSMETRMAEVTAAAEAATAAAALERHAREESEYIAKVTPLAKAFPGEVPKNAALLYRVKKAVKPEDFTALETILKAGATALEAHTSERGHTRSVDAEAKTLSDELTTMAKTLAAEKKIPFSEAYDQVIEENPDKVAEVRKAQKRRRERDDEDDNN